MRYVDGLTNPKVYHRPTPQPKKRLNIRWRSLGVIVLIGAILSYFAGPKVKTLADDVQLYKSLTNGRYLVLFQNDAEVRASGGFIGSFAIIEAKNSTIQPVYFETNIYKLDDPYNQQVKNDPPLPLKQAIGDRGWGLRDSNFAADFRQSAPTVEWFFNEEAKRVVGPRKADLDKAMNGDYHVDGVIATNMSAFLDLLDATGPITLPENNITVNRSNFFPIVQQIVEKDYFADPNHKTANEPKQVLQNLFPLALKKAQTLGKTAQYHLLTKLLREKKVVIYSNDATTEDSLTAQGWAGALQLPSDIQPKTKTDFLAIVRSAHGGNKSSLDINPVYRYSVDDKGLGSNPVKAKLEVTFEHTGTGDWPSGINHEYVRAIIPTGSQLVAATQNGQDVTNNIDLGTEFGKTAFGFWMHTQPKSSQTMVFEYTIPKTALGKKYQLTLIKQPGGNAPDVTVIKDDKQLLQGRLTEDRLIN